HDSVSLCLCLSLSFPLSSALSAVSTEIRAQLAEQFKCLDFQVDIRNQYLQDVGDFFRRKAEIELEYSRGLERLAERFSSKIRHSKEHQNIRKDQNLLSPVNCWYLILSQTRKESKDHVALSEVYTNNITLRLAHISEDVSRLSKRSKEIGIQMQEELFKVTSELQTAMKTYHQYHTNSIIAETKLKEAEKQLGITVELAVAQPSPDSKPQRRSSIRKAEKIKEK
ncbi:SLIT-ROBO Rho GTPase-activating protein 3-like, partial [Callorhinchus milii]|uniref:SLIT-ROBO Rho GTPase-activating protein 3-like n=1 Tax=Callorhinchus milii TaxID=7868 RepID=UPI001C3FA5ED